MYRIIGTTEVAALLGLSASQLRKPEWRKWLRPYLAANNGTHPRYKLTKSLRKHVINWYLEKRSRSREITAKRKNLGPDLIRRGQKLWELGDSAVRMENQKCYSHRTFARLHGIKPSRAKTLKFMARRFPPESRLRYLSWFHYREAFIQLVRRDEEINLRIKPWLNEAIERGWGPRQLRRAIDESAKPAKNSPPRTLSPY